jgi:hypothetical protein
MKCHVFMLALSLILSTITGSCASSQVRVPIRAQPGTDYELKWVSDERTAEFLLTLRSKTRKELCMSVDSWPNRLGQVTGGSVKLKSGSSELVAKDTNFGYCVGAALCTIRISPHGSLSGSVAFKEFGELDMVRSLPKKQLIYDLAVFFCGENGI